jgi:phosphoribosylamine--glycine ligase
LRALAAEGFAYRGVLYAGLMLTADGPKVIEYNVRFGDPECQVVLPRLTSDLGALCLAAASGVGTLDATFGATACVTVVLAAPGYPGAPRAGDVIAGVDAANAVRGVTVFHAGTARGADGALVTAGGRVLDVTAVAPTIEVARERAYEAARLISWSGLQYRHDIATPNMAPGGTL